MGQQQQATERTFDENGNTVLETIADGGNVGAAAASEGVTGDSEQLESDQEAAPQAKFRIGSREFATQEEALAFATSQISTLETEQQVADAYRQGVLAARGENTGALPAVTAPPAAPRFNAEELYTDPEKFLDKYARTIKEEATTEIQHAQNIRDQSDAIWRGFTDRHPGLADFRSETEDFVAKNQREVQAVIATKGRDAAFDFIATKLKAQFERYNEALKPKRTLPNGSSAATPNSGAATVTTKPASKKPLSFSEQIRSIRRGRA